MSPFNLLIADVHATATLRVEPPAVAPDAEGEPEAKW
jgi:hypothetical protein